MFNQYFTEEEILDKLYRRYNKIGNAINHISYILEQKCFVTREQFLNRITNEKYKTPDGKINLYNMNFHTEKWYKHNIKDLKSQREFILSCIWKLTGKSRDQIISDCENFAKQNNLHNLDELKIYYGERGIPLPKSDHDLLGDYLGL